MLELLQRSRGVFSRVVATSRERGFVEVATACGRWGRQWVSGRPARGRDHGVFAWEGHELPYFVHDYHYTWLNERAVEIPMALAMLERHAGADVLEIGNVLGHYAPVAHTVVDKYEVAEGVANADVADLDLGRTFDVVMAISTLEHVGLDEDVLDEQKPARAIQRLRAHLKPGGLLWVTHPVGYNPALDRQLRSGELGFTRMRALRRSESRNTWTEVPLESVWDVAYDRLLYTAHAVVVAELDAP